MLFHVACIIPALRDVCSSPHAVLQSLLESLDGQEQQAASPTSLPDLAAALPRTSDLHSPGSPTESSQQVCMHAFAPEKCLQLILAALLNGGIGQLAGSG